MAKPVDHKTPETALNGQSPPESTRLQPSQRRHWYIREIVVGVLVMVLGSYLVWVLRIGPTEPRQTAPAPAVKATERGSIFTREIYATIQPGLTAWELEDILGPSNQRQKIRMNARIAEEYALDETDGDSSVGSRSDGDKGSTEYEEMVWGSGRSTLDRVQLIGVLLKNGEVVARKQWGIE